MLSRVKLKLLPHLARTSWDPERGPKPTPPLGEFFLTKAGEMEVVRWGTWRQTGCDDQEHRVTMKELLSDLGWSILLPQPGGSVPVLVPVLPSGDPHRGPRGVRSGVRVLAWDLRSGGSSTFAQSRARLILQGLGAGHGAGVGLHRNQVGHLRGRREHRGEGTRGEVEE